jgi:hypothetical protein
VRSHLAANRVPLNRAKESHQSTIRAPLTNSPAVSLFTRVKSTLSPTRCASAADVLCYADCAPWDLRQVQHALSNITLSALLSFATCPQQTSASSGVAFLLLEVMRSLAFAASQSASLCFGTLLLQLPALCSLSFRASILRQPDITLVAAQLNSMLECFPEMQHS